MRLCITGLLAAAIMFGAVGCVSQQRADELETLRRTKDEQILDLQTQLEEAEARIDALNAQANRAEGLRSEIEQARAERDRLEQALADAERQLREAGTTGLEIPQAVSDELERLAREYPDLMSYDPDLGMIQLQSDLTFDLGSADVKEPALNSLRRLAQVLGSRDAQPYEIRVVGHTDTVPIENPATRRNHPTNWHLSAHRAIAVKDALENAGIAPRRMNVSGYGPYRPVAPNGPRGAEANRRVEIYLMPMTRRDRQMMDRLNGNAAPANNNSGGAAQPQDNEPMEKDGPVQGQGAGQDKSGPDEPAAPTMFK